MKHITFVTGNKNKVRETEQILQVTLAVVDIDLEELQETDLKKVAFHKLDEAYKRVQKPVIIDDVSVAIHAWNGFPGPLIKWILQASGGSPKMLLKMLEGETDRRATATLAIGFHDGKTRELFLGEITGTIAMDIEGDNGFGWDKVFILDGQTNTLAQMPVAEKNKVSHRRKALDKLKDFLMTYKEV